MVYILHLSDLHFGTSSDADRWYGQLYLDLKVELNCSRLDALILSGDIANFATEEEYRAAEQFLNQVCINFQLTPSRVIIVPGNHDVNWTESKEAIGYDNGKLKLDESKHKQRFKHFRKFYRAVKHESYPLDYEDQGILYPLPAQKLLILGLNSAWKLNHLETKATDINPDAIDNALRKFFDNQEQYRDWFKLAVWHHPLNSPDEDRIKDHGFMQKLAVAGFRLALHGHVHKAEANLFRYDMSPEGRKLDIVSAGTFGAPTKELVSGYPWQYNLLELTTNKLTVRTRRREEVNGTWKSDARWTQGVGRDSVSWYELPVEYMEPPPREHDIKKPLPTPKASLGPLYSMMVDAILAGEVVFFLGDDINLCGRKAYPERELEKWRSEENPPTKYPPNNIELALYLEEMSGNVFRQSIRCPLCKADQDELPSGCPIRLDSDNTITRMALQQVSQCIELSDNPFVLQGVLQNLRQAKYDPNLLHNFFAGLPAKMHARGYSPPYQLIVTTCLDSTLENAFKKLKQPFDLVFFISDRKNDRFVHQKFTQQISSEGEVQIMEDGKAIEIDNANASINISLDQAPVIIKLYGGVDWTGEDGENLVITEEHYIDYLAHRDIAKILPINLLRKLRNSHLLFLGYSPSYWNLRVILHRIWQEQILNMGGRTKWKWWAIQWKPEILDKKFWEKYTGIPPISEPLQDFIVELENKLDKKMEESSRKDFDHRSIATKTTQPKVKRDQVFISYSHKDKAWLERLQIILKPVIRAEKISVLDDTQIPPGAKWKEYIKTALKAAKVAVLLVSHNFLASDFIHEQELPPLLEAAETEGLRIIWIYLSECLYNHTDIKDYQAAHDISQPLALLPELEQQGILVKICDEIIVAVNG